MRFNPVRSPAAAACLLMLGALHSVSAFAATVFSDGTFSGLDWSATTGADVGISVSTSQVLSGGNPGAASETSFNYIPGSGLLRAYSIATNSTWTYDPTAQGTLETVSFSADRMINGYVPVSAYNVVSVVEQNGKEYEYRPANVPLTPGNYFNVTAPSLTAGDYVLVLDNLSDTVDATQHPDFTAGVMTFGFRARFSFDTTLATQGTTNYFTDNVSYTLQAVPLPAAMWLMVGGLGVIGVAGRRRGVT